MDSHDFGLNPIAMPPFETDHATDSCDIGFVGVSSLDSKLKPAFRTHATFIPDKYKGFVEDLGRKIEVTDKPLWSSFMCFVLQYIAAQPANHISDLARTAVSEARDAMQSVPDHGVMVEGIQQKVFPFLDTFRRDRSFYAHKMFKLVWPDGELTSPRLSLWCLLVCMFRYTGSSNFFKDVLLCDSNLSLARAAFADGLSADNEASVWEVRGGFAATSAATGPC